MIKQDPRDSFGNFLDKVKKLFLSESYYKIPWSTLGVYIITVVLGLSYCSVMAASSVEAKTDSSAIYPSLKKDATEIISKRTQNQKVFDNHDGTEQYIVSSGLLHYKDDGNKWQEIDTQIEPAKGDADFEMVKSIYQAQFKKNFNSDKIIHIEKNGFGIAMIPGDLSWISGEERQLISNPQETEGKAFDNKITYPNAYGDGLDFSYEANDINLMKKLTVHALESLLTPNQKILDGVNPELALNLSFELDKDMDIFIDSQAWDGTKMSVKDKNIEFKSNGTTIWQIIPPRAWDSQGEEKAIDGDLTLEAKDKKISISISFPYPYLKDAQYPVTIDPDTYYGEMTDGYIVGSNAIYNIARTTALWSDTAATFFDVGQEFNGGPPVPIVYRGYLEFDTSGIVDTDTVTQANLYLTASDNQAANPFVVRVHKYNWSSPINGGNRQANYIGVLASDYDADWRDTSAGVVVNTTYGSSNLDPTWVQKGATLTQYVLLSDHDVSATAPFGPPEYLGIYSQRHATQAYRPYLSVTVTPAPTPTPGGSWSKLPTNVLNFQAQASDGQVQLSWQNPTSNFRGLIIQRKTGGYPISAKDGDNIYDGSGTSLTDTGLTNGTTYYYTAYSYVKKGRYSLGVSASATPQAPALVPEVIPEEEEPTTEEDDWLPSTPSVVTQETQKPAEAVPVETPKKAEVEFSDFSFFVKDGSSWVESLEKKHFFSGEEVLLSLKKDAFSKEISSLTLNFGSSSYPATEQNGNFEIDLKIPGIKGSYKASIDIIYKDGTKATVSQEILVDPYGYVYKKSRGFWASIFKKEEFEETRIFGATVTLYYYDEIKKQWIIWDGEKYKQKNPQETNQSGEFGFMTPQGKYYLEATKSGYESYKSAEFEVKDQVVNKNIELQLTGSRNVTILISLGLLIVIIIFIFILRKKRV